MKNLLHMFLLSLLMLTTSAFAATKIFRLATEATYPPFEYIDAKGNMQGFDVDIAKALCAEMKTQCQFTNQSFNSLIPSLALGKFDAIIAAIGVTSERQKQVDFTSTYYEPSASFIGVKNKNYSISNLNGKIIGVQQGSTFEKYLHDKYAKVVQIKAYASIQDAFLDLIAERVDMVLTDTPIANDWLRGYENNKIYGLIDHSIIDHDYFGTGYAIAVKKNNTELLKSLNQALETIKKNGTYAIIAKKYFDQKNSEKTS